MSDWKSDLNEFLKERTDREVQGENEAQAGIEEAERFLSGVVLPAFDEIKSEFENHDRDVHVMSGRLGATITVRFGGTEELSYTLGVRPRFGHPYREVGFTDRDGKRYKAEGSLRSGAQDYTIKDVTQDELIADVISQYRSHNRST